MASSDWSNARHEFSQFKIKMFHETIVSPAKNSYSTLFEKGLIFCFQEIDIGLGPFSISADRIRVVDFLHPINYESFAMIIKKPSGSIASSALLVFKPYAGMNRCLYFPQTKLQKGFHSCVSVYGEGCNPTCT